MFAKNFRDYGHLNAYGIPKYPFMIPRGAAVHPLWINGQTATDDKAKHKAHGLTFVAKPEITTSEYMVHHHEGYIHMAKGNNLPLMYSNISSRLWFVSAIQTPETVMPVSSLKLSTPEGNYAYIAIDESWTKRLDLKYTTMLKLLNTDYLLVEFPKAIVSSTVPILTTYWGFAIFIH